MKKWYQSKTMWTNIVTLVIVIATGFGLDLSTELQAEILTVVLAVVNLVLRFSFTDTKLE